MKPTTPLITQQQIYKKLSHENILTPGHDVYLISRKWLSNFEDHIGHFTGIIKSDSTCGPINNSDLVLFGNLKKNIKQEYDYEIIPKELWDHLHQWYGGGPILKYSVIQTPAGPKVILHPLKLNCYYQYEPPEIVNVHQYITVKVLKEKVMKLFNVPSTVKSRLWDYSYQNLVNVMQDDDLLERYQLDDDQEVFLDTNKSDHWDVDVIDSDSLVIESVYEKVKDIFHSDSEKAIEKKVIARSLQLFNNVNSKPDENQSVPGVVGLYNICNTTYFNVILQCIFHNSAFMNHFLSDSFLQNNQGPVISELSKLMKQVWSIDCPAIIAPTDLKYAISNISSRFGFSEYEDPIDFLTFFLSVIQDELDKRNKKYIKNQFKDDLRYSDEFRASMHWAEFVQRKQSFIIDDFYGQLKYSNYCSKCGSSTSTFDVYNVLSLPIRNNSQNAKLKFIPLHYTDEYIDIRINSFKEFTFEETSHIISNQIHREVKVFVCSYAINSKNGFHWGFPTNPYDKSTQIYAFEYDDSNTFFVICLLMLKQHQTVLEFNSNYSNKLVLLGFNQSNITADDISIKASSHFNCLWKPYNGNKINLDKFPNPHKFIYIEPQLFINQTNPIAARFPLESCNNQPVLSIDQTYPFLSNSVVNLYFNPSFLPPKNSDFSFDALFCHDNFQSNQKEEENIMEPIITLSDLLEDYLNMSKTDDLKSWFCNNCKAYVFGKKKTDIWSGPNFLIIHFQRFWWLGKKDSFIQYPLTLTFSQYTLGLRNSKRQLNYQLHAVILHSGDSATKHFSCFIYVVQPDKVKGKWYHFDNTAITECTKDEIIDRRAYILFYQKVQTND